MQITTEKIQISTRGHTDIVDLTGDVQAAISRSGLKNGQATVFAIGSTAGITTTEFEPGLVKDDLPKLFEKIDS